jgi:hypothetical protein
MSGTYHAFGQPSERYGSGRHPDLPWGYWLVSKSDIPGHPPLVDEDGREWDSVREAFWEGRLGFESFNQHGSNAVLEFMGSYLAVVDHRFVADEERIFDIFQGDRHLEVFFRAFLAAAGLVDEHHNALTPEGRAVLLMLIATRTQSDAEEAVGLVWIVANQTVAGRSERKIASAHAETAEQVAVRMLHRFTRDTFDGRPGVKLIGLRITKEIPVRSTLWSLSWPVGHTYARDRFYLWLLERIDRWDEWSEMVAEDGARSLTEHLMKLAFCDRLSLEGSEGAGTSE